MINILHTSDLHGKYQDLLAQLESIPYLDIWIDTGDFFPNKTRGDIKVERHYQEVWAMRTEQLTARIAKICIDRNISIISVSGNHDYVSLATLLRNEGMSDAQCFDLSSPKDEATVCGIKFAGFREIPWIAGEWAGETELAGFNGIVEEVFSRKPDVLVTHAPPGGILDMTNMGERFGVGCLSSSLMYLTHNIRAHLFGHVHNDGGKTEMIEGIMFSNAAAVSSGNMLTL